MPETAGLSAVCGQATGLPGNNAATGREPGGSNPSHKLAEKVGLSPLAGEQIRL